MDLSLLQILRPGNQLASKTNNEPLKRCGTKLRLRLAVSWWHFPEKDNANVSWVASPPTGRDIMSKWGFALVLHNKRTTRTTLNSL